MNAAFTEKLYIYQKCDKNYSSVDLGVKSTLECAMTCSLEGQCLGVKLDQGSCHSITDAQQVDFCQTDVEWAYMGWLICISLTFNFHWNPRSHLLHKAQNKDLKI